MKNIASTTLFAVLLSMFVAFAQNTVVINPQSIVVNTKPSFDVSVSVDRDPSGSAQPSYAIGDPIHITVGVNQDAFIYLFNVRSSGAIDQIMPNSFDDAGRDNFIPAGASKTFPPPDAQYTFSIDGPTGLDKIIAVASQQELDVSTLTSASQNGFRSGSGGQQNFARTLSVIVNPLPQESWVTDTALFHVGSSPTTNRFGTVSVNSTPSGATVYVDGQFRGYTPVTFGELAGSHSIRLEVSGYNVFEKTFILDDLNGRQRGF